VSGTSLINVYIPSVPYDIISIEGKVLFLLGGIWVSDGTISGTKRIYAGSQSSTENPFSAVCLLSFKGKGYFFSQFYDATTLTIKSGFYVTNGTDTGTYILKYFGSIDLVDSRLLFISNSAEKIYFRNLPYSSMDSTSFNLWSSDGTSIGTKLVSTLTLKTSPRIKFGANLGNWFLSIRNGYRINSKNQLWVTQGDSLTLLNENNSPDYYFSEIVSQDSISYFSLFDTGYGLELWSSDGTKDGTGIKKELYKGVQNSEIINILDFSNFLLFFGDKGNRNIELFKYELPKCENGQNESARSGEWMSKYTWACGRIPRITENPKILSGDSVTIPTGSQLLLKNVVVESGGVLSIESGSTVKIIPEN
jgi:ELWxxDGT repeat protein